MATSGGNGKVSLGICTRYKRHEATYAGLRFAAWAQDRGDDVSIFTTTPTTVQLDARWDGMVNASRRRPFTAWAREQTTLLWTHVPHREQVIWAKSHGIMTLFFPLWHELVEEDKDAILAFDAILTPSRHVAQFMIRKWGAKKVFTAPWDAGVPITSKDPRIHTADQWLLLPLYDDEPGKTEMTAIEIAGRALYRHPNTVLTVLYNSSTLGAVPKRRLKQFRRYFGERIKFMTEAPIDYRPLVFRCHDLTLWPTQRENTGMVGVLSMTMGTPVIAFEGSPLDDLLNKHNGMPIPCGGTLTAHGVPKPIPDYSAYEDGLNTLLANPDYLRSLQQTVSYGLLDRRGKFNSAVASVYVG